VSDATQVEVNGEGRRLPAGTTVEDLVRGLGQDPRTVAVELNGEILARASYGSTRLASGDRIEIVRFVQGG
jgi:thiamine biosynthesis protein ThiS